MALFAGVWRRAGSRVPEHVATELLAALHAPFHSVLSALEDGPLVMVARSLDTPAVVSHSGIIAAAAGRLDGDLHAEDVLDAYMGGANDGFQNISGDYAIALFDPRRRTLVLLRDAIGSQPLYYHAADDGTFTFASQIKAVIAGARLTPRPNRAALSQLLVAGEGVPRGQTCFEDVYALSPGQALFVTPDSMSLATHVELRPVATPMRTFEESAAAFRHALTRSVARRIAHQKPTAVFLSGGLDSSAITALAAREAGPEQVIAISYGCDDGTAADERTHVDCVVGHCKVRGQRLPLQPVSFTDNIDAAVWANESPLIENVPGTLQRAAKVARDNGARDILIGNWGDQVLFPFPPPYMSELLRKLKVGEYRRFATALAHWHSDVPPGDLRNALIRQAVRTVLPPRLLDTVRPARKLESGVFDTLNGGRVKRRRPAISYAAAVRQEVTGPASVTNIEESTKWGHANGVSVHLPYLDADLLQMLMAVPGRFALHDGVPKALLRTGLANVVPASVLQRTEKGDYTHSICDAIASEWDACLERLQGGERLVQHGMMSGAAANAAMARLKQPQQIGPERVDLLTAMAGLEAWLRTFFDTPAGQSYA